MYEPGQFVQYWQSHNGSATGLATVIASIGDVNMYGMQSSKVLLLWSVTPRFHSTKKLQSPKTFDYCGLVACRLPGKHMNDGENMHC